jgi:hypothetical protein
MFARVGCSFVAHLILSDLASWSGSMKVTRSSNQAREPVNIPADEDRQ